MSNRCDVCLGRVDADRVPLAAYVATGEDRTQWFECEAHAERENVHEILRVSRQPIAEWLAAALKASQAKPGDDDPDDDDAGEELEHLELARVALAPGTAITIVLRNEGSGPAQAFVQVTSDEISYRVVR